MFRLMKTILYWLTIVPPFLDALSGAVSGIKKGIEDIHNRPHPQAGLKIEDVEDNIDERLN